MSYFKRSIFLVVFLLNFIAAKAELIEASSTSKTTSTETVNPSEHSTTTTTTETVDVKQSSTEIPTGAIEVTPTVDSPEEIRRIQQEQLKMIMRMHKAEDMRNAEIRKRHEAAIKSLAEKGLKSPFAKEVASGDLAQTTVTIEENKTATETPKKKSFWQKIFGVFSSDKEVNPAVTVIDDDF